MVLRLRPVRALILGHDAAGGPEFGIVVSGVGLKSLPVGVGDFELADVESVEIDGMDRAFARFAIAEVVTHLECACGDEEKVAVAVVDDFRRLRQREAGDQQKRK